MMRRPFAFASLVVAATIVACSSFGDANDAPAPAPAGDGAADGSSADANADDGGSSADAGGDADPESNLRFCERTVTKVFRVCDDFEIGEIAEFPWLSTVTTEALEPSVVSKGTKNGDSFAHVEVPVAPDKIAAFLRHDLQFPVIRKAKITFGLTFTVTGFDANDYVEIAQLTPEGSDGIGIAFDRGTLRLFTSSGATQDIALPARGERNRVVVEVTADHSVARSGLNMTTLMAPFDINAASMHLGVGLYFSTGPKAAGKIDIDDVVIDY